MSNSKAFFLLFFKRHAVGEFQLYNPIADGPEALLTRVNPVGFDFRDDARRAVPMMDRGSHVFCFPSFSDSACENPPRCWLRAPAQRPAPGLRPSPV